ncbi:MAG TPA: sulfite exporter TauE/SafE family protein [Cytophagaceae bacterium]|nr:sulfite exporter TauE/SafE family protein [Cytophagaceae bacterium]
MTIQQEILDRTPEIEPEEEFDSESPQEKKKKHFIRKITRSDFGSKVITKRLSLVLAVLLIVGAIISYLRTSVSDETYNQFVDFLLGFTQPEFLGYVLIGFIAQIIDGALGMAYGASSMTMLTSYGVSSSIANSCIKLSEVFTTSASGFSHWKLGNINKKLVKNLIIPGVIGAAVGATMIAYVDSIEGVSKKYVKPFISIYILLLGIYIIYKALRKKEKKKKTQNLTALASFGGFMDAAGGGGWGPIVTSTLISKGRNPKYTIGSVNLSEFFIALTSAIIITIIIGLEEWQVGGGLKVVIGLIFGGIIAAPMGALVASRVKAKPMMLTVGTLIIVVNLLNIYKAWFK